MKIIDAHMHYYNVDGFVQVAANAGYENTAACWQKICEENNIVFSVAMGNTNYTSSKYGGVTPRMIDLARLLTRSITISRRTGLLHGCKQRGYNRSKCGKNSAGI